MKLVERQGQKVMVELDERDLLAINNALNEVCNGIHFSDSEFQIRLGVTRDEAQAVLTQINGLF